METLVAVECSAIAVDIEQTCIFHGNDRQEMLAAWQGANKTSMDITIAYLYTKT